MLGIKVSPKEELVKLVNLFLLIHFRRPNEERSFIQNVIDYFQYLQDKQDQFFR